MKGVKQVKESTGRMKKHRYSTEFKVTAVKMASSQDVEVQTVAEALSIHPFMLSRWKKEYREGKLSGEAHAGLEDVQNMGVAVAEQKKIRRKNKGDATPLPKLQKWGRRVSTEGKLNSR